MKPVWFAVCASLIVMTPTLSAMARARSSATASTVGNAEQVARGKMQAANRARLQAMERLRMQRVARYRLNAILQANALAAQKQQAGAVEQAARAQRKLAAALPRSGGRIPGKALASYRKWAGSRLVRHKFQGMIPPSELRRFEPGHARPPADGPERCTNAESSGDKITGSQKGCAVPGS